MRKTIIAAIAILAPVSARAEVPADVTVLFEQGLADMRAGNLEVACKQLAAALAKFDDSGIAGTLAECFTKQGKVVSAWRLWKDLAETAAPALRPSAARNAAQLEPRLPRYTIRLQEAVAGLTITINSDPVADPTLPTPLPVDPGPLVVVAKAPAHEDWSTTLHASEGTSTTIEVPALTRRVVVPEAPPPPPEVIAPVTDDPHRGRTQRRIALGVGGAGLVALGVGAIYGISAAWTWSDSKPHCRDQGGTPVCDAQGVSLVKDTLRNGNVATLLIGAGLAAVATGGVLWLAAPKKSRVERRLALAPALGAELAGVSIQGRF